MSGSNETGERIQSLAAKVLGQKTASDDAKSLAGSALTQAHSPSEQTSDAIASLAGRVLADPDSTAASKSLAGSVLAQKE